MGSGQHSSSKKKTTHCKAELEVTSMTLQGTRDQTHGSTCGPPRNLQAWLVTDFRGVCMSTARPSGSLGMGQAQIQSPPQKTINHPAKLNSKWRLRLCRFRV